MIHSGHPGIWGLHDLRHACCTHLVRSGTKLLTIKELAGHSSIQTTMRYLHLDKGEMVAEINMAFKKIASILVIFLALGQGLTE